MLKQRVITAVVLAPLALLGVFALPPEYFVYLLDFVVILAAWEWANLSGYSAPAKRLIYVLAMAVVIAVIHFVPGHIPIDFILAASLLLWLFALYWVVRFPLSDRAWTAHWRRAAIGFAVLIPCWFAFLKLKQSDQGELYILLLFLLVWGADVGAYFAGKNFGKAKLAPKVSPGKTREGLYGGLCACVVVALVFAALNSFTLQQSIMLLFVALATGLISVLGDLFESMLKRYRGIKDSSRLLPGHGGVLDRIDSVTAASPLFVLGLQYLVQA